MNRAPRIEFENILLRQPAQRDIQIRAEYGVTKEFAQMTGTNCDKIDMFSIDDAKEWFERIENHPCKWLIEYKGVFIGAVSLRTNSNDNKGKYAVEIYNSEYYGMGIGKTVTRMVLKYAFEELKYHKVFLRVLSSNKRAISCYEKCGFRIEGIDREGARINGKYESDIYMGILKREFENSLT